MPLGELGARGSIVTFLVFLGGARDAGMAAAWAAIPDMFCEERWIKI
jgi:hypothetical protein